MMTPDKMATVIYAYDDGSQIEFWEPNFKQWLAVNDLKEILDRMKNEWQLRVKREPYNIWAVCDSQGVLLPNLGFWHTHEAAKNALSNHTADEGCVVVRFVEQP